MKRLMLALLGTVVASAPDQYYKSTYQDKKSTVQDYKPIVQDYKPIAQDYKPIIHNSIPAREPVPHIYLENDDGHVTIYRPKGADNLSTSVYVDNTINDRSGGSRVMNVFQEYDLPRRTSLLGRTHPQHYVSNSNTFIKGAGNVVSLDGPQISYSSPLYPRYPYHYYPDSAPSTDYSRYPNAPYYPRNTYNDNSPAPNMPSHP